MTGEATDDEIEELIIEKANKHEVPPELLLEIYESEREVVNMERRGSILKDVKSYLEEYVDISDE